MILRALFHYLFHFSTPRNINTRPVPNVDTNRMLGRWYELARLNVPFEEGMEEVFADYTLRPDGNIDITNQGMSGKHRRRKAHAIAYPGRESTLKVSFIPFLRCLTSSYNVLSIDDNYTHALVSNGNGSCLWFLSRNPKRNPESFNGLMQEALRRGFDLSALHYTKHRFC